MHPATATRIQELEAVDWFRAVGEAGLRGVKLVASWMEAIAHCASYNWEHTQQSAADLFKQKVRDAVRGWSAEQRR